MKKLILYKNNRIDRKYKEDLIFVISNYIKSDWHIKQISQPFERKFLAFLTDYYNDSTFDPFGEKDWQSIYNIYKELR